VTCCFTDDCNRVVVASTTTTTTTTSAMASIPNKVDRIHVGRLDNVVVETSKKGLGNSKYTNGASATEINSIFTLRVFLIVLIFLC
jgi:hypothetical protein